MEQSQTERHPQIRIRKNTLAALKDFALKMEKSTGTRFSMSAFASDAILKALGSHQPSDKSRKEVEAV